MSERVGVIGLGYVGLPVAIGFARVFPTVGFDISPHRIARLRAGVDETGEIGGADLLASGLLVSENASVLAGTTFFIVTVPTPVDAEKRPDFKPLTAACASIGPWLTPGAVVVFESTVYPGATDQICGPALVAASGLKRAEFSLGYSPERINPGDASHRFESIVKVVAGETPAVCARLAAAYGAVIPAGIYQAPSIAVAEAAKVIENTQRDVNIALMNELALIFDKLEIKTREVLAAARTKWNFLPFTPGLVGGHCIGVDPYYLTAKAEAVGHHPQVILSGRRINDQMGRFVGQKTVKLMVAAGIDPVRARVAVLGLTFKEDVPDLRNSQAPDIVKELAELGVRAQVHDPAASAADARAEYGLDLVEWDALAGLDVVVLAVPHQAYRLDPERILALLRPGGVLVDVRGALAPEAVRPDLVHWSL